ncbi:hypothetical protein EUTSA_v10009519mg [Eutrema salsugineum]|uniref:Bifunctional inhibitor/plant lipid transfer protein/seed storage helical domain-containing protein n=1 Tax=Eutrema salsugineum TaxID=72664 RepID=V4KVH6_EUTSA|nr:hypothetical protein EUTSA_v10009519mg [Eutrema salsugineum]
MMSNQNGDRHCGMAQGKVISSCLHRDNGQSRQGDCCQALYELNLQAETPNARQDLCRCFQEIVWLSPYNKLIGLPEHCGISKAVPFDTKTDCGRTMMEDKVTLPFQDLVEQNNGKALGPQEL